MQIKELLTESYIHRDIPKILKAKGYRGADGFPEFDRGIDQIVALEPDTGMILKIFGTKAGNISPNTLTSGQKAWIAFSEYCLKHPNNPFLPQFQGWETFEYNGKTYLQIRSERLFPLSGDGGRQIKYALSNMAFMISDGSYYNQVLSVLTKTYPELLMYMSENDFKLLYKTIRDLKAIADHRFVELDLHAGNFMQTSDGQLVINDPFHSIRN